MRWIDLTTPNPKAFFGAAGEQAQERILTPDLAADVEEVMAAAKLYGVAIVGPPPVGAPH